MKQQDRLADALRDTLVSKTLVNSACEPANIVDALHAVAQAMRDLAAAIRESSTRKEGDGR